MSLDSGSIYISSETPSDSLMGPLARTIVIQGHFSKELDLEQAKRIAYTAWDKLSAVSNPILEIGEKGFTIRFSTSKNPLALQISVIKKVLTKMHLKTDLSKSETRLELGKNLLFLKGDAFLISKHTQEKRDLFLKAAQKNNHLGLPMALIETNGLNIIMNVHNTENPEQLFDQLNLLGKFSFDENGNPILSCTKEGLEMIKKILAQHKIFVPIQDESSEKPQAFYKKSETQVEFRITPRNLSNPRELIDQLEPFGHRYGSFTVNDNGEWVLICIPSPSVSILQRAAQILPILKHHEIFLVSERMKAVEQALSRSSSNPSPTSSTSSSENA